MRAADEDNRRHYHRLSHAITCAVLLRLDRSSAQPRYQLYSIEDTSAANGKTVKWVYRLDTISGKTWRMTSKPTINTTLGKDELTVSAPATLSQNCYEFRKIQGG